MMRLAVSVGTIGDGTLQAAIQYCKDLELSRLVVPFRRVPGFEENGYLDLDSLKNMKAEIEDAGLSFSVMVHRIASPMLTGAAEGEAQFGGLCKSMEVMGEIGADIFMIFARLGAPEDPQWGPVVDFYRKLVGQGENCGVKIALHSGFRDWSSGAIDRIMRDAPSPSNGLCLCMGNVWLHEGERMYDVVRRLGEKVFFVHLRSTKHGLGETPFWFDSGEPDFQKTIQALRDIDYRGDMRPEHMPTDHYGEPGASDIGTAWAVGYMKALLQLM
jgi:D-mannonate dehydratase